MKFFFAAILITCLFSFCSDNNKQAAVVTTDNTGKDSTPVSFFPVTSFLEGQMAELDSLQITFLHIITVKEKTDSVWERRENIRPLLKPFLAEKIDTGNLTSLFKVTKFNDQTINAITFTYEPVKPLPDSVSLRHWDLYINPETGKVSKVYILREVNEAGKKYTQQLTWQTGKWAKINTLSDNVNGITEVVKEDKVVWRFD
jgi:hypothetical protein